MCSFILQTMAFYIYWYMNRVWILNWCVRINLMINVKLFTLKVISFIRSKVSDLDIVVCFSYILELLFWLKKIFSTPDRFQVSFIFWHCTVLLRFVLAKVTLNLHYPQTGSYKWCRFLGFSTKQIVSTGVSFAWHWSSCCSHLILNDNRFLNAWGFS